MIRQNAIHEDETMRNSYPRILAAAVLLAALSACASSGHRYQDRNMDFGSLRTVAVMPFQNLSRDNLAGDRVRDVFSNALLATEALYVVPNGEVARAHRQGRRPEPASPRAARRSMKLGQALKAEAIITGTVKEYGEVRSGTAAGNAISLSVQMHETATGKVIWTGTTTKGGVGFSDRLFGGGGNPHELPHRRGGR